MRLLEAAGGHEELCRRVRLPNGHVIRLTRADDAEWRFRYGFKGSQVTLETPAAEKAVVAALAALEGKATQQPRRMRYALALSENFDKAKSGGFDSLRTLKENMRNDPRLQGARGADRRNVPVARLLRELLRHYRDEFDDLPEHKRAALMEQAAGHLTTYLESLRNLTAFLETGDPTGGIPKTKLKITQQQLRAAELVDVVGLSHREIGAALGLPLTDSDKRQGGHQKAKERVRQGKKLLRESFGGEEGYSGYIEQKKQEAQRWASLTTEQRYAEDFGESFGIPADNMLLIMTGDLETAAAELAKLEPDKAEGAIFVRSVWGTWDLDDLDSPPTLRTE